MILVILLCTLEEIMSVANGPSLCSVSSLLRRVSLKTSCSIDSTRRFVSCPRGQRPSCVIHQQNSAKLFEQKTRLVSGARQLHTSQANLGLEEFFGDPKLWSEPDIKSGREWKIEDLRLKDNETIHKLWYVLLKERNMLLTLEEEAERQEKFMPGDDRLEKVELSMAHIKELIRERDEAVNKLQFGRKEKHPGHWEYTPFGFMQYVKPKEHLVPKFMNKYWASQKRQYDPYMKKYINLWLEKVKKERWRRARMEYKRIQKLKARFPDSDMWKEEKDR